MVSTAPGLWDYMINLEHLEWKVHPTTRALPLLLAVEDVLVLTVWNGCFDIRSVGNVGAVRYLPASEVALLLGTDANFFD